MIHIYLRPPTSVNGLAFCIRLAIGIRRAIGIRHCQPAHEEERAAAPSLL